MRDSDGHPWGDWHGHPWAHGHDLPVGFGSWPETLLSTLGNVLLAALLLWLAWSLLKWISPYILPSIADLPGIPPAEHHSALEILRERYAAGEIDAVTFQQMQEQLAASYGQGSDYYPPYGNGDPHDAWVGDGDPRPETPISPDEDMFL